MVFQRAPLAVAVVTGENHELAYANAAFSGLVAAAGAAPGEVVLGTPIVTAFPTSAAHALLSVLHRVRVNGAPERGTIPVPAGVRCDSADSWPCMAWPLAEARTSLTDMTEWIVIAVDATIASASARVTHRDVTERVLLSAFREEERADIADAARLIAEQVSAARSQLLAATSHELRTPLQAIGGYAELMEMGLRGPVTEGQRDALVRIRHAMRHILELSTELLDYARLEAGRMEYVITDVSASAALREAATLLEMQASAKGVMLAFGECDAELTVRADASRLRQVLVNLIANAIKFTAPGGVVTLSCEAKAGAVDGPPDRRVGWVVMRVADTGCGIPADKLATVFDSYVQVGRRLNTNDAGVGLGLTISRGLARGMGADVTAESEVGVGSTFTLTLPRAGVR